MQDEGVRCGAVSGEILYQLQRPELAAFICGKLCSLLDQGRGEEAAMSTWNRAQAAASEARSWLRSARSLRLQRLEVIKRMIKMRVAGKTQKVRIAAGCHEEALVEGLRDFDRRLACLCMHYVAVLEREQVVVSERLRREQLLCDADAEQARLVTDLDMFALHLEHETRSKVQFRRLAPTHPQFIRCCSAASENIKPGFFLSEPRGPYVGVKVLDVYRIENQPGLAAFQCAALEPNSGKVKGLFCRLPRDSLEYTIVNGVAGPLDGLQLHGKAGLDSARGPLRAFRESWYQVPRAARTRSSDSHVSDDADSSWSRARALDNGPYGYAANLVRASSPLRLPSEFSRYSTFESDKAELMSDTSAQASKGSGSDEPASRIMTGGPIRMLALCRVLVGKIYVSGSSLKTAAGEVQKDERVHQFDSVYSSEDEEYLLLNPAYVLPEFVILYRFQASHDLAYEGMAGADNHCHDQLLPCSLEEERPGTSMSTTGLLSGVSGGGRGGLRSARGPAISRHIPGPASVLLERHSTPQQETGHQAWKPLSPFPMSCYGPLSTSIRALYPSAPSVSEQTLNGPTAPGPSSRCPKPPFDGSVTESTGASSPAAWAQELSGPCRRADAQREGVLAAVAAAVRMVWEERRRLAREHGAMVLEDSSRSSEPAEPPGRSSDRMM